MKFYGHMKRPKIKRSHFDLSHEKLLSCNMGYLVPILVEEVLPGDKFSVSTEALIRFAPMLKPAMASISSYLYYFYVPNRIIDPNWQNYITGYLPQPVGNPNFGMPGVNSSGTAVTPPTIKLTSSFWSGSNPVEAGSLADYMGVPTIDGSRWTSQVMSFLAYPFMAYQKIWNEYFRDEMLQNEVPTDISSDYNVSQVLTLRQKNWERDYFTSSGYAPMVGNMNFVQIPVQGTVTATGEDASVNIPPQTGTVPGQTAQTTVSSQDLELPVQQVTISPQTVSINGQSVVPPQAGVTTPQFDITIPGYDGTITTNPFTGDIYLNDYQGVIHVDDLTGSVHIPGFTGKVRYSGYSGAATVSDTVGTVEVSGASGILTIPAQTLVVPLDNIPVDVHMPRIDVPYTIPSLNVFGGGIISGATLTGTAVGATEGVSLPVVDGNVYMRFDGQEALTYGFWHSADGALFDGGSSYSTTSNPHNSSISNRASLNQMRADKYGGKEPGPIRRTQWNPNGGYGVSIEPVRVSPLRTAVSDWSNVSLNVSGLVIGLETAPLDTFVEIPDRSYEAYTEAGVHTDINVPPLNVPFQADPQRVTFNVPGQHAPFAIPGVDLDSINPPVDAAVTVSGENIPFTIPGEDLPFTIPGQQVGFDIPSDTATVPGYTVPVTYGSDINIPSQDLNIPGSPASTVPGTRFTIPQNIGTTDVQPEQVTIPGGSYPVQLTNLDATFTGYVLPEDIRSHFAIQRFFEKGMRYGVRYVEQIMAHFGVHTGDARLQRPEYLGAGKAPVIVSEVLQTSATAGEDFLAQQAGHGISSGKHFAFKRKFKEHGYIIGLLCVSPRSYYYQGMSRHLIKRSVFDYAFPDFAHLGEQAVYNQEVYVGSAGDDYGTFGYQPKYQEYRVRNSTIHGDFRTNMKDWHLARDFSDKPNLNDVFQRQDVSSRIFADTNPSDHHLWIHLRNNVHAVRPLPRIGVPGRVDHG